MATFLVLVILGVCVIFAIRSIRKNKGCAHDCNHCAQSCSSIQQGLSELLEESKRKNEKKS